LKHRLTHGLDTITRTSGMEWRRGTYFNKIIEFCGKQQIKLVIVCAPYMGHSGFSPKAQKIILNGRKKQFDKHNIPVLNFNTKYNEVGLDYNDFKDPSHVNVHGAKKVSEYFCSWFKNNIDLKSL